MTATEARCPVTELYTSQCGHCLGIAAPKPIRQEPVGRTRSPHRSDWVPVGHKECTRCHAVKKTEDFYRDYRTPDGRKYWCKRCHTANTTDAQRRRRARQRGQS